MNGHSYDSSTNYSIRATAYLRLCIIHAKPLICVICVSFSMAKVNRKLICRVGLQLVIYCELWRIWHSYACLYGGWVLIWGCMCKALFMGLLRLLGGYLAV
jgi:hypothetical protein